MELSKHLLLMKRGGLTALNYISTSIAPELFFKFDETSGTSVTNYGSLGGTATWTPGSGSQNNTAPVGKAYDLDGSNSRVEYANNATMANAEEFAGGMLVNADSAGKTSSGALWIWGILSTAYNLRFSSGLALVGRVDYATDAITLTSTTLSTGVWQWIFYRYSLAGDRKLHVYRGVNGAVAELTYTTNTASSGAYSAPSGSFMIGAASNNSLNWDGKIGATFWKSSALATTVFDDVMRLTPGV